MSRDRPTSPTNSRDRRHQSVKTDAPSTLRMPTSRVRVPRHKSRESKQAEAGDDDGQCRKDPRQPADTFFITEFFCIFLVRELIFEDILWIGFVESGHDGGRDASHAGLRLDADVDGIDEVLVKEKDHLAYRLEG